MADLDGEIHRDLIGRATISLRSGSWAAVSFS
jgi:hypothetical protein